jgi:alpha-tubulin suppressor-like RCC1 family protein
MEKPYPLLPPSSNRNSDQDEPTYVDALRGVGVRQIACGSGHTVVLTVDGEVYTWGRGDDGRLGHGDNGWKVRWLALWGISDATWRNTCGIC